MRVLLSLLIVCLLGVSTGCRKRETPVEIGNREGIIHLGNGAEPRDLDPHTAASITEGNILNTLFEGLVISAPDGKTVLPGAAERWEVSPDGRTYTFHLRAGLQWNNGDALTSEDFLYSFRRIIEPKLASEMAIYANWIVGAQEYNEGKTTDLATVGLRAPDPRTFEIALKERTPFWLTLITQNPFYPVHRASVEKYDAYLRGGGEWTRPGNLVGNGPFTLKEWRVNDSLTVEKNPRYWDAARVALRGAVFHPTDDPGVEERNFRGGLLHTTRSVPATRLPDYRQRHPTLLHADPLASTKFVLINTTRPPFDDPAVRLAFAHALDREALVRDVRRDGSRVADSLCVPGSGPSPGYTPRERLRHEPTMHLPADTPRITLIFTPSRQGDQALCEAMQAMWEKELGVRVELVPQEEKVWLDSRQTKNYQLLVMSWLDINDPVALLQLFVGGSPLNDSNWSSPDYDREYAHAGVSATDAERLTHLQNADALLVTQAPLIPLFHENQNYLVQSAVRGWQDNPSGWHLLQEVSLEPGKP